MLESLRTEVLKANVEISRRGLAKHTFGNASAIDRRSGHVVIKPSGMPYDAMSAADMVITDLDGKIVEGSLRPSSDLATHVELYRAFKDIGGIVHTHSHYATSWAQSLHEIPCLGTTHADCFRGPVPLTDVLTDEEIETEYEKNTGLAIVRRFAELDPMETPAVLVANHASFVWGPTVSAAVETADILEEIASMAYHALTLDPGGEQISDALLDKHFLRKHGAKATYGQRP
ncbi:MAG TPA: L-ribulose-5-phosphate 4-epimerase AraD [Gemmatimonadaceae bacterium]|jgi:L-ribulose-5-phosphate 4-epimerase